MAERDQSGFKRCRKPSVSLAHYYSGHSLTPSLRTTSAYMVPQIRVMPVASVQIRNNMA